MRFPIGTRYWSRGQHKRLCTVVDVHSTYNRLGQLVKLRYVSQHEFLGQIVTDEDVVEVTIARGSPELPTSVEESRSHPPGSCW